MTNSRRQKDDDGTLSKNHGDHIKYRKRKIEEKEVRQEREDSLREWLDEQKKIWYDNEDR
jgi:hypothetical protein